MRRDVKVGEGTARWHVSCECSGVLHRNASCTRVGEQCTDFTVRRENRREKSREIVDVGKQETPR